MWKCSQCMESLEDTFDCCWQCGNAKDPAPGGDDGQNEFWTDTEGEVFPFVEDNALYKQQTPGSFFFSGSYSIKDFLSGKMSLSAAFWIYGVFGWVIMWIIVALASYFIRLSLLQYGGDFIRDLGFHGFMVLFVILPRFFVWLPLTVGVWRCGSNSIASWKWISRGIYVGLGLFYFGGMSAALILPQL